MKTAYKIAGARAIYHAVHASRVLMGLSDQHRFVRDGIAYDLDLSQGIDFAIFLAMYERQTKAALRKLVVPGSLVLDIGANIGAHTLTLSQLVGGNGQVMAFEPTDFAYRKLRRNIEINPDLAPRIMTYQCFLSSEDEAYVPDSIYSSWPLKVEQGLHAKHLGRAMQTDAARARSIDSILAEAADRKVQLVKLDVDGFECDVLSGATALLRDARPLFVMELAPYVLKERGTSLEELVSYFTRYGYKFYDENSFKPLPSSAHELDRLIRDGEGHNVIARVD